LERLSGPPFLVCLAILYKDTVQLKSLLLEIKCLPQDELHLLAHKKTPLVAGCISGTYI